MKYSLACAAAILCCFAVSSPAPAMSDAEIITEIQSLKDRITELENTIKQRDAQASPPAASEETDTSTPSISQSTVGKSLLLPDISLVTQALTRSTTDGRDIDNNRVFLSEAEIGFQGYVYPNVKTDAFLTASPAENQAAQVEEAYLTYLGLKKGVNFYIGKKHVPFGRTNLLHSHSWPYTRQPLVITNFVAPESLTGQGADFSYLLPTGSAVFAQLDLGTWASGNEGEASNLPDIVVGPGADFTNKFNTARLWTGSPVGSKGEVEAGASYADGDSLRNEFGVRNYVHLKGVDFTFRHFGEGTKRLMLRGEGFWRRGTTDSGGATATGYYMLGQYRPSKYGSVGLLYDWTEFPQATNLHESAISLILTRQMSEQYYLRTQLIYGSRPGDDSYFTGWLQWVWGIGPHTHNLE